MVIRRLALACVVALGCNEDGGDPADPGEDEGGQVEDDDELEGLDATDLLIRASLDVRGVRPSAAELDAVAADPAVVDALIAGFVDDPAFGERVKQIFAAAWRTRIDFYETEDEFFEEDPAYNAAIGEEPLNLVEYVAMNDRPFTEILTSPDTFVDPALLQRWPLDELGPGEGWTRPGLVRARYNDGRPMAGVLSMNSVYWRHSSTVENANRGRANALSQALLCQSWLDRPIDFPTDLDLTDSESIRQAISNNAACQGCHSTLDPLASYLWGFMYPEETPRTNYSPEGERGWAIYTDTPPGYFGQPGARLVDLGGQIAGDERFVACTVRRVYEGMLGRPAELADEGALAEHREAFLTGNLTIKALVRSILTDPSYRGEAWTPRFGGEPAPVVKKVAPVDVLAGSLTNLSGYTLLFGGTPRRPPRCGRAHAGRRIGSRRHHERLDRCRPRAAAARGGGSDASGRCCARGPDDGRSPGRVPRRGRPQPAADRRHRGRPRPGDALAHPGCHRARARGARRAVDRRRRRREPARGVGRPPDRNPRRPGPPALLAMLKRRTFLGSAIAGAALFGGMRPGMAQLGTTCNRFLFLNAEGGWDPLAVFAPLFDANQIDMEAGAERWNVGGLSLVDHPQRPTTRTFFENHASEVALFHGVSTRSVNHEICQVVALTGSTSADRPDFATILAVAERDNTLLPHLVMSGPAFPGKHSVFVSNAQGQLQQTVDGTILVENDAPLAVPEPVPGRIVDRFLGQRAEALQIEHPELVAATDYREAVARAKLLNDSRLEVNLRSGTDFLGRAQTAISALSSGLCRCATVGTGFNWDTHQDNSLQSGLFEGFFDDLEVILADLDSTLGPEGQPLRNDTIIVVTSEMARTPAYNATGGRDHWPYTTMFMIGPGVVGGRSYGGYTNLYTGIGVGPDGGLDMSLPGISAESLGATLLALGGVDPEEHLRGATPIAGVIG